MSSFLLDLCMPMSMPTGFPHTHVRACWIHTCTPSQGTNTCMHRAHAHSLTHRAHACTLAPGPYAHSLMGPISHAHTGSHARSPTGPISHACTRSPCPLACRVPTQAHTGPCMHAHSGPPHLLGLHACMHWAHARMLTPGPHMHLLTGSPCMHICVHWMHHVCIPQLYVLGGLYVVVVICSSSSSTVL